MMKKSNQRAIYGEQLLYWGERMEQIVVLEADLGKSTMTSAFQQAHPERYFEMGIAEANMTGFATGLSLTGRMAFTNSFAVFSAGRAYDQIRQGIAIGRLNVKVIGSSSGLSDFGDGATHQAIEDMAIMRAIPNMTVLAPADGPQVREMMEFIVGHEGPVYMRLCRNDLPEITRPGTGIAPAVLREGADAALIACGVMVSKALEAADRLKDAGVEARVVNVPCIKPLDEAAIGAVTAGVRAIVTCEEHSVIGGLSQAVCWALRGSGIPMDAVAVMDEFGQSAHSAEELYTHYHLQSEDIAARTLALLGRG
jgi:transketolase